MLVALALLACHPASDVDDTVDTDVADTDTDVTDTDTDVPEPLTDDVIASIAAAATADLENSNATGVEIALWRDGHVVWHGEYGTRTPTVDQPPDADTLFQVGSDTKKMTAITVLQQVEAGKLDLDAPLVDALPGFSLARSPDWSTDATLHDLMSHQGGLYDYTPWTDAPDDGALHDTVYGTFAENEWAMAPPGVTWNYANPNFSVAGLAAETAAGRPYADVLEQDVFAPLGMTRTFARKAEVVADGDYAVGHGVAGSMNDDWDPWAGSTYKYADVPMDDVVDNAFLRPAGLVWSTASDMARFAGFLVDGDAAVVDDADLARLHTGYVRLYPSWDGESYGYGLFLTNGAYLGDGYYAVPVWLHGGNTLSFTSTFYVLPEQRVAVSILSNGYGDDFSATVVTALVGAAGDALPEPVDAPAMPTEETDHAKLVGVYDDALLGEIDVTDVDGTLQIAIPSLADLGYRVWPALTFALTDVYTFRIQGAGTYDVTFVPDETGQYQFLRNRGFVGERASSLVTTRVAPPPAEVAVRLAEARLPPISPIARQR